MTGGVLSDILRGFAGQLRRSPWGVALLWVGLVIATVAVVMGFSLARSVYGGLHARMPGELDRLYEVHVTTMVGVPGAAVPGSGGPGAAAPGSAAGPVPFEGFTVAMLERLLERGIIDGYYVTITGRPVRFRLEATRPERDVMAVLQAYGGRTPLYQGRIAEALALAASEGDGVVVNRSLAREAGGLRPGDTVRMTPTDERRVVAVVGPEASWEPAARILVPARSMPGGATFNRVSLYLPPGADPAAVASELTAAVREVAPNATALLRPVREEYADHLLEAALVSTTTAAMAVLVALVAFVNAGSFATVWVLNRRQGLALRRALGATPGLVALYVTADLALIALSALLVGLLLTGALWVWWLRPLEIAAVNLTGLVGGTAFILMATALLSRVLTRTVSRSEPGALLGRVL